MGGGKGEKARPSSPASVVCCMCGDQGMPQELFRCKTCLFRSQHKYCSDLYPKAETYKTCNWCLREEAAKFNNNMNTNSDQNSPVLSSNSSNGGGNNNNGGGGGGGGGGLAAAAVVKLQRGAFPSHLNKPVKKQRLPEKSPDDLSPTTGVKPNRHVNLRAKVRRYKLLEEVSS